MIVLDASAAVEILLQTPAALEISNSIFENESSLHCPHLLDAEVVQVLRRYVLQGVLTASRAEKAVVDLQDLPIERYSHHELLGRVWALRHNLTAYDALYVALAEALGATLLTRDRRIERASGHTAQVRVF